MPYTLEQIQQTMLSGQLTPEQVSNFRVFLSALYSLREGEHDKIRGAYPETWLKIREGKSSDRAADREWEATDLGRLETRLTSEKRRIDKLIQALATKWKALEGESRNLY